MKLLKVIIMLSISLTLTASGIDLHKLSKSTVSNVTESYAYQKGQSLDTSKAQIENYPNIKTSQFSGVGRVENLRKNKKTKHVGTGFVIDKHTFVTNAHVVSEKSGQLSTAKQITFQPSRDDFKKPYVFHAKSIKPLSNLDIAIVKTKESMSDVKPVKFANQRDMSHLKNKDKIFHIGYPKTRYGGRYTVSKGNGFYLSYTQIGFRQKGMVNKMAVRTGASGSPIFNQNGRVIGIVSYSYNSSGERTSSYAKVELSGGVLFNQHVRDELKNN